MVEKAMSPSTAPCRGISNYSRVSAPLLSKHGGSVTMGGPVTDDCRAERPQLNDQLNDVSERGHRPLCPLAILRRPIDYEVAADRELPHAW